MEEKEYVVEITKVYKDYVNVVAHTAAEALDNANALCQDNFEHVETRLKIVSEKEVHHAVRMICKETE